jgi:isocitrate dehydrogenase kinase/phosphatase
MMGALPDTHQVQIVKAVFYRGKLAYLVGRLFSGPHIVPLVLTLLSTPTGIVVDAVLLTEDEASVVFSFARSYFHVDIERPYNLICFLAEMMPRKPRAELYTALGYNKHGKTEFYRDLLHHLAGTTDKFEIAEGERGMVMITFTLPSYDVIFKIIKDRFDQPKKMTRQVVVEKYHLVYQHDRAGRMIDAHRFERLKLARHHFSETLLAELQQVAAQSVQVEKDYVLIKHGYVERLVIPLNIYVNQVDLDAAQDAVIDYGNTIKDLIASNIFPGDLLLKNFGVTRHGRVVFYDYDEICLLTDCNFRVMPPAPSYEDEFFAEPWFSVDENDIFPEQFHHFLGLRGPLRDTFIAHHADLFEVDFWREIQERIKAGEIIHIFPYHQSKRLLAE